MPRSLKRSRESGAYGWSYVYGRDQRETSEQYKENYDKIEWKTKLGPPDHYNRLSKRGKAAVWVWK